MFCSNIPHDTPLLAQLICLWLINRKKIIYHLLEVLNFLWQLPSSFNNNLLLNADGTFIEVSLLYVLTFKQFVTIAYCPSFVQSSHEFIYLFFLPCVSVCIIQMCLWWMDATFAFVIYAVCFILFSFLFPIFSESTIVGFSCVLV